MIDRRASAENESNSEGDDDTLSYHDTTTPSTVSPPMVELEIHDIEGIGRRLKSLKKQALFL